MNIKKLTNTETTTRRGGVRALKFDLQRFAKTWTLTQTFLNGTWPRNYTLTYGSNSYATSESYSFGYGPAAGYKNYGDTISELLDRYTSAGDTIAIQGNIDVSQPIVITKELTFDMSNGSLTAVRQLKNN